MTDYENQYPKHEEILGRLRGYVKEGKRKVRELREKLEESKKEMVRLEKVEEREGRMVTLEFEHDFFTAKLDRRLLMIASKFPLGSTCHFCGRVVFTSREIEGLVR